MKLKIKPPPTGLSFEQKLSVYRFLIGENKILKNVDHPNEQMYSEKQSGVKKREEIIERREIRRVIRGKVRVYQVNIRRFIDTVPNWQE